MGAFALEHPGYFFLIVVVVCFTCTDVAQSIARRK